jgi:hypothetical protein
LEIDEQLTNSWRVKTVGEKLLEESAGNLLLSQRRLIYEPFVGMQGKRHIAAPAKSLQNSLIKFQERRYPIVSWAARLADVRVSAAGTDSRPTIVVSTPSGHTEFLFHALRVADRVQCRNEAALSIGTAKSSN